MKNTARLALGALCAASLSACGGASASTAAPAAVPVVSAPSPAPVASAVPAVTFTVGGPPFATAPPEPPHAWRTCRERGLPFPC